MDEETRVLLVTPDYPPPPGGIQTLVRNLERGLDDAGVSVAVEHVDPEEHERRPGDYLPRPRWCYTISATATLQFVYLNAVYRRTIERIEQYDPDVVHAMHVRNWPALVAAKERGIPTVVSTHALELGEQVLAAEAVRTADRVHAVSRFTESLVSELDATATTRVVPPAIDVSRYRDARTRADSERSDTPVVTMARFVARKNVETVIEAWKRLDDEVVEGHELVVVGDGPNERQVAARAEGRADVRLTGWISETEKCELLADAATFTMVPRRDEFDVEGFGIVYIEAQAAGTPVVGSKHGGAPEAIGDAGIVVEDENDPEEVADALQTMLTDDATREQYEGNADARIDQFDIPAVTESFEAMYEELLE